MRELPAADLNLMMGLFAVTRKHYLLQNVAGFPHNQQHIDAFLIRADKAILSLTVHGSRSHMCTLLHVPDRAGPSRVLRSFDSDRLDPDNSKRFISNLQPSSLISPPTDRRGKIG